MTTCDAEYLCRDDKLFILGNQRVLATANGSPFKGWAYSLFPCREELLADLTRPPPIVVPKQPDTPAPFRPRRRLH